MTIWRTALIYSLPLAHAVSSLWVETTAGVVHGSIDPITPNVAQFLGVPYAEQPLGARRWLPPIPAAGRNDTIEATNFGPACPQFEGNKDTTWLVDAPEFKIVPRDYMGEDCLSVNLWVPWTSEISCNQRPENPLPVIAWIHGGSFQTGGASIPYQNPARWVQRSKKHIVVGINYRLNIFGTPNAAGLKDDEQNLGLLDQRLALEWIRDNIATFGGDPNRITLWGHSAGAVSVDSYNFAYPEDPIVSSLIMSSGTSLSNIPYVPGHSNFTVVAKNFGCGSNNATAELACLSKIGFADIIAFLKARSDNGTTPPLVFTPMIDNRTVFANYTTRALVGNFTRKPAIIGTTVDEYGVFLPYNRTYGPNQTLADSLTLSVFLCPSVQTTHDRLAGGNATTFRYLYSGNFSNIAPRWWQGAYHQADMPLIFGTHGIARSKSTALEVAVSEKMQDYWLAFAEDPVHGLPGLGWREFRGESAGQSVLIGWNGTVVQSIADRELEEPCDGRVPNGKPKPPVF